MPCESIGREENVRGRGLAWQAELHQQPGRRTCWVHAQALLLRIATLRAAGRAVILLGDLNISLAPIDSCDPGPLDEFVARPDRVMVTRLLSCNGGPFLDVFRRFHPTR